MLPCDTAETVRHLVENLLVCRSQRDKEDYRLTFELLSNFSYCCFVISGQLAHISRKSLLLKNANYMIKLLNVIK